MTEQDDITDMKKCRTGRRWMIGLLLGLGIILAGCGSRQSTAEDIATPEDTQTDRIVVGFSQLGAESDWRSANTESMKVLLQKRQGMTWSSRMVSRSRPTRSGPSEHLSSRRWTTSCWHR